MPNVEEVLERLAASTAALRAVREESRCYLEAVRLARAGDELSDRVTDEEWDKFVEGHADEFAGLESEA